MAKKWRSYGPGSVLYWGKPIKLVGNSMSRVYNESLDRKQIFLKTLEMDKNDIKKTPTKP